MYIVGARFVLAQRVGKPNPFNVGATPRWIGIKKLVVAHL